MVREEVREKKKGEGTVENLCKDKEGRGSIGCQAEDFGGKKRSERNV